MAPVLTSTPSMTSLTPVSPDPASPLGGGLGLSAYSIATGRAYSVPTAPTASHMTRSDLIGTSAYASSPTMPVTMSTAAAAAAMAAGPCLMPKLPSPPQIHSKLKLALLTAPISTYTITPSPKPTTHAP